MDCYDSVKRFGSRVATLTRLNAVLANAGLMISDYRNSEDNEKQITVNVVSTFLLCRLVLPKLREPADRFNKVPRFVIPNSALHYFAPLKELDVPEGKIFETLNNPETALMVGHYFLTKLFVIYAIRELAAQTKALKRKTVVLNSPNPSFCKSGLLGESPSFGERAFKRLLARDTEVGSRPLVHGIISGVESHGQYLTNCHVQT